MGTTNITGKDKETINFGTSLAAGCQPCMKYHLKKCKESGMSEKEIYEIIHLTEEIYSHSFEIMKSRALSRVNSFHIKEEDSEARCNNRQELLVGLAVSYTLNNPDLTDRFIKYARQSDMSDDEISRIMELSKFNYSKAKAHVDILIDGRGVEYQDNEGGDCNPGCGC